LSASSGNGALVTLSASNNIVSNNGWGIAAYYPGSRILASGNTVSDNSVAFDISGGLFESTGNNAVRNNSTDATGPIITVANK
jgi:parallel beta-helix repeat protein